jgi:hypothetical protein
MAPGPNENDTVHPIAFIVVEALLIAFFVFGYVLYRRRRRQPRPRGE